MSIGYSQVAFCICAAIIESRVHNPALQAIKSVGVAGVLNGGASVLDWKQQVLLFTPELEPIAVRLLASRGELVPGKALRTEVGGFRAGVCESVGEVCAAGWKPVRPSCRAIALMIHRPDEFGICAKEAGIARATVV